MTSSFLYLSAAVILAAIALLAPTLLRRHQVSAENRQEYNVGVARDRLQELKAEHEQGELSDEEFNQARQDLDIALAQDLSVPSQQDTHNESTGTGVFTLIGLLLFVPLIVGVTYLQVGTPAAVGISGQAVAETQQALSGHTEMPPLSELVKGLERQLQENPENPDGWFLLGRTYMSLSRYEDAAQAYGRLDELQPDNTSVQIALADALSMVNGGRITQEALALLQAVHQREPENVIALWLLGNESLQRGEAGATLAYWSRAYPLLTDDPEMQMQLRDAIRQVESDSGLSAEISDPAPLPAIMPAAPTPAAPSPAPAKDVEDADIGPGITVEVALDPELMDRTSENDTVFVYAKAASGPPMPLAVSRQRVADLPIRVRLTDDMAMMPQMKLSSFPQVKVGARISKTGQAIGQSGDLQSEEIDSTNDNDSPVQLLINSQRP